MLSDLLTSVDVDGTEANKYPIVAPANERSESLVRPIKSAVTVIGLMGAAGSGKTTAAAYLAERFGFERVRFAGPLKDMLRAVGLGEDEIEGGSKETPSELLLGKTPRQAMQWLGTEWGRNLIGEDFWVNAWAARADRFPSVVAEDVRFPNEIGAIRSRGGIIIRIECPWAGSASGGRHASEQAPPDSHDITIRNDRKGEPNWLFVQLREAVRGLDCIG